MPLSRTERATSAKVFSGNCFASAIIIGKFTPLTTESNNWVIDGTLSASGRPMLASDPHRALAIPSLRYMVHLHAPGWNVIGSGEPALPGVALRSQEATHKARAIAPDDGSRRQSPGVLAPIEGDIETATGIGEGRAARQGDVKRTGGGGQRGRRVMHRRHARDRGGPGGAL